MLVALVDQLNGWLTSHEALVKLIGSLVGPLLALALAWLAGHRLTAVWAERQKRREMTLVAVSEFCKLYGEFFVIWKLWNYALSERDRLKDFEERRQGLLERAAAAESSVETTMLKITTERRLSDQEIAALACFRQAYQSLRQCIGHTRKLGWANSHHPEYLAFKRGASDVTRLISTSDKRRQPTPEQSRDALRVITDNMWENIWSDAEAVAEHVRKGWHSRSAVAT